MAINSTLGTTSPQLPTRSEPFGKARRSSTLNVRKPSHGPEKPSNVSNQNQTGPSLSRKPSVSALPTAQASSARWKDLQKQLPGWLAEKTKGTPVSQESSRSSLRTEPLPMAPARVSADTKENRSSSPAGRWAAGVGQIMTSAGKKDISISSTAGDFGTDGSRRGSAQNNKSKGALSQRFADVVRQATKPAWLSASNAESAGTAPGISSSQQARVSQLVPGTAQSTAQDLVGMINARLSGQGPAFQ